MNIRQDTSIGRQISLLPFISLIGFVIILSIQYAGLTIESQNSRSNQEEMQALRHLRHIQFEISNARISEKNFLLNQRIKDAIAHKKSIDSIRRNLEGMKNQHSTTFDLAMIENWEQSLTKYQNDFLDMSRELTFIGYNENTGLRGTMRKAIHLVERRLGVSQPVMLRVLLQMRRHEKDFIILKDDSYVSKWAKSLATFRRLAKGSALDDVDKLVIGAALRRYADAFRLIVEHTRDLQVDQSNVDASSASLLTSISKKFEAISLMATNTAMSGYRYSRAVFSYVVVATIAIGIFVFVLGRWIGLGISAPLTAIGNAMKQLSEGDLETRIPGESYQNEIGEMAKSVRIFRENAKERRRIRMMLREANRQNQNVIQSMHEALFEVNIDGRIKMANPAAERLLGLTPGALIGKSLTDYFVGGTVSCQNDRGQFETVDANMDSDLIRLISANRPDPDHQQYMRRVDGKPIAVQHSGALLHGDDDKVTGAICVVRDVSENIVAEQEVKQFKLTLDRVIGDIYMFAPDSLKFIYVNEAARQRVGKELDEIYDLTPMDVTPGLDEAEFRARLQPLIDGSEPVIIYESVQVHKDGHVAPEEIFIQLIKPEGMEPRFIAFVTDITERKKAENNILRFKSTLDAMADTVFMFHPDTLKFTYLNEEAKRQTGWDEDEYCEKTPADINPIFDEARFRMLVKPLVFGTQKSVSLTTVGLDKKPVELTIELFEPSGDDDAWFVVTTRDISDRREAEKQARQFKKTLDLSQDEVYMFWPDSLKFIYQNQAARKTSGWTASEYVTKTLMDNNENFDPDEFRKIAQPLIDGTEKQIVYEKYGKNDRPIEVSLQLIKPSDDKPRFVAITRDISERKLAEKAKNEFVSTVSHELRTPLTSIKGALGIINTGVAGEMSDKLKSLINIALTNSDRLVRLINDILDIEKIEAGKMEYRMEAMDLSALITESLSANEGYADAHQITFIAKGVDQPIFVNGDYGRMMQVMANLMSNAAKFSSKGAKVEVVAAVHGQKVRVSVIDTGSGIPKEAQATIFDKFTQADSSDRRKKGGTGLGLSIVKMMVKAHGGDIDFVSEPGKGTEFFFELDILPDQTRPQIEFPDIQTDLHVAHLLICEDDPDIASLLKMMLGNAGYHADIATTAQQAKDMLLDGNFDGMTLDLCLPDQDGMSLLRELRAIPKLKDLPVFVISANIPAGKDGFDGHSFGVIDWIKKPIDEEKLVNLLHHAIDINDNDRPNILHVEDDRNILEVVREIIGERANVFAATTVEDARRKLELKPFDLVILDLNLPDGYGGDLLPYLNRPPQHATPVLVFSAQEVSPKTAQTVAAALVKSRATNADFLKMVQATLKKGVAHSQAAAE